MNKQPWEIFMELFSTLRHAGHDPSTCGKLAWAEALNAYYSSAEAACIQGLRNVIEEDTNAV